jgi:hypothetical protein
MFKALRRFSLVTVKTVSRQTIQNANGILEPFIPGNNLRSDTSRGPNLFDRFDQRYKEGLALILQGAASQLEARKGIVQ